MDLYQIEQVSITEPLLANDDAANEDREQDNFWEYEPFSAPGPSYAAPATSLYVAKKTGDKQRTSVLRLV